MTDAPLADASPHDDPHDPPARAVHLVARPALSALLERLGPAASGLAAAAGFDAAPGATLLVPDVAGGVVALHGVAAPHGVGEGRAAPAEAFALGGRLVGALPAGDWALAPGEGGLDHPGLVALGWCLGAYRFERHRKAGGRAAPRLVTPAGADGAEVRRVAAAVALGRDLVNRPANDLGPAELAAAALDLAAAHGARAEVIEGEALRAGFPMVHAVGRASAGAPRLVDLRWDGPGEGAKPALALVGKGVTFDTGGLDLKPEAAMLLMKKDMGGAAAALAAAAMIMGAGLPLRLRVVLPIVENAVGSDAFRPGDVLVARDGTSVEVGNTDAEGRLILADALALVAEEPPDLTLDFATLTGAARVALGPDLPAFFTDDEALAAAAARLGEGLHDPVWRLPLWRPYERMLESRVADTGNVGGSFAGAITAALFLRRFAPRAEGGASAGPGPFGPRAWGHLDLYGWTPRALPGRPEGGEAQGARLAYGLAALLCGRDALPFAARALAGDPGEG